MKNLHLDSQKMLDKYVIFSATDPKGVITEVSQAFCEISGYSKEELVGKPHSIVRHPDMPADTFEKMWRLLKQKRTWEGDIKNRSKSGQPYWVHAKIEPLYEGKKIAGYFAIREDITDKKLLDQANSDLGKQVDYIKAILDSSKTAIATIGKNGVLEQANSYFLKKFSLDRSDCDHVKIQDLIQNYDDETFLKNILSPLKKSKSVQFERMELYKNFRKYKSKTVPVELNFTLLPETGSVVVVINFIKDRLRLKNSLKKSQIYFKKASVGFFITDENNVILKANPKFRSITGYKKGQLKKNSLDVLFESEVKYRHCLDKVTAMVEKQDGKSFVFLMKKSDGSEFWAEVNVSKFLPSERIKNENIFWSVRDITSKIKSKRLIEEQNEKLTYLNEKLEKEVQKKVDESIKKDQLHRQEQVRSAKFTAIGQLAAGITHEINTPLTYIKGNLEMMELDFDDISDKSVRDEIKQQMQPIKEGLSRISNIIENMREMSQKTKEEKSVTNIYATMITALTMLHNRSIHISKVYLNGQEFSIGMDKDAQQFLSYAQPQRLEQVWVIIINNAFDELASLEPYERRRVDVDITQDEFNVYVKVIDNAGGIDPKILDQIFEPFESSKDNKGMGVGLSVAKQIVSQQEGSIKAYNKSGGAIFEIKLKRYRRKET